MNHKNIRNKYNYVRMIEPFIPGRVSITEPDKSMSITEIMARFARGQSLGGRTDTYYDEESEFDDMKDYDLTEIEDMKKEHSENFARLKESQQRFKSKLQAENEERAFKDRLNKEGFMKKEEKKDEKPQ